MQNNYHKRVETAQKRGRPQKSEEPPQTQEPVLGHVQVLGIRCPGCGRAIIPKTEYTWQTSEGKRTACCCPHCPRDKGRFVLEADKIRLQE